MALVTYWGRTSHTESICVCPSCFYFIVIALLEPTLHTFHALIPMAWLADEDSPMCCIVTMGRQIAKMFYTFSL